MDGSYSSQSTHVTRRSSPRLTVINAATKVSVRRSDQALRLAPSSYFKRLATTFSMVTPIGGSARLTGTYSLRFLPLGPRPLERRALCQSPSWTYGWRRDARPSREAALSFVLVMLISSRGRPAADIEKHLRGPSGGGVIARAETFEEAPGGAIRWRE